MGILEWGYTMGMVDIATKYAGAACLKWWIYDEKSGDVTMKRRIPRKHIANNLQIDLSKRVYTIYVNFQWETLFLQLIQIQTGYPILEQTKLAHGWWLFHHGKDDPQLEEASCIGQNR